MRAGVVPADVMEKSSMRNDSMSFSEYISAGSAGEKRIPGSIDGHVYCQHSVYYF